MDYKFGKARQHVRSTGGSGGDGGSVVFAADSSMNTLQKFRTKASFVGARGNDGEEDFRAGSAGKDLVVTVPSGTLVFDNSTSSLLGTVCASSPRVLVAKGGVGGRGNGFKSAKGERLQACAPSGGQRRWLRLELQLIADVGLIGAPNAGKSTLLGALTNAKPKIADYPFTTLVPNLGVCDLSRHGVANAGFEAAMVLADIPGLIEGAHRGLGLGKEFLRHVSHCQVLVHVIDATAADAPAQYLAINRELALHSADLAAKPQVVLLNKVDRLLPSEVLSVAEGVGRVMPHSRLLCCSATGQGEGAGLSELVQRLWRFLAKVRSSW